MMSSTMRSGRLRSSRRFSAAVSEVFPHEIADVPVVVDDRDVLRRFHTMLQSRRQIDGQHRPYLVCVYTDDHLPPMAAISPRFNKA
jgi:hypothetical protein